MKIQTVECKSYTTAKRHCPWASKISKVEGGFKCFESVYDYKVFKGQK